MIALILSILLPGLGQFYYGKNIRAIFMLLLTFTPLYPIALIWTIIDIILLNKQDIEPKFSKKEAIWTIVILFVLIPAALFFAFSGVLSLGRWYSEKHLKAGSTLEEGHKIVSAIISYHKKSGSYPNDIYSLVEGIPVRSGWVTDSWGENYIYEVNKDGKGFKFISKGIDRTLGTNDDIIFK